MSVRKKRNRPIVHRDVYSPNCLDNFKKNLIPLLSSLSIELTSLPVEVAKKLPRQAVPCALIGRLAVNEKYQGEGIGKLLLIDAFKRTLNVSQNIVVFALIVDSINDNASIFYRKFGFQRLNTGGNRLFLPFTGYYPGV